MRYKWKTTVLLSADSIQRYQWHNEPTEPGEDHFVEIEAQMRPRGPVQTECLYLYLFLYLYLYFNIYFYLYLGGTILFKWGANEAETSSPVLAVVSSAPPKCGSTVSPPESPWKKKKRKANQLKTKTTNDGIEITTSHHKKRGKEKRKTKTTNYGIDKMKEFVSLSPNYSFRLQFKSPMVVLLIGFLWFKANFVLICCCSIKGGGRLIQTITMHCKVVIFYREYTLLSPSSQNLLHITVNSIVVLKWKNDSVISGKFR